MIDTVGFKAIITYDDYERILEKTRTTQRIDKETGETEFEYDNGQTVHSHNYKIIYKITDDYWYYDEKGKMPFKEKGIPHVKFEFSVPKILFGHNITSAGMGLIYEAMYPVKLNFEDKYNCTLPKMHNWYCYRIDICANYILDSEEQVRNYISYLSKLDYPRRKPNRYGDSGIYCPSRHSTLKVYAKGPEFKVHDMERLREHQELATLREKASRMLRIEIENKGKLKLMTAQYNSQFDDVSEDKKFQMEWKYYQNELKRLEEEKLNNENDEAIEKRIEEVNKKIRKMNDRTMMFHLEESPGQKRIKTFEGYPRMGDLITIIDCKYEMTDAMRKLLSGTEGRVTECLNAENTIRKHCSQRQAPSFIAIYYSIINQGQDHARKKFSRNIYYRALKFFRETGVTLLIEEEPKNPDYGFPRDFSLSMEESNKYYQVPLQEMPF